MSSPVDSIREIVAAQEPIAWKDVVSAINAVAKEAASRGGMFPQEASEQREDSEAAKRVCGMIEWYATCGGSVAMRLPDWPLYDHGAACARCEEAERIESIATAKLGEEIIKNGALQDKLAKQAAEIERLSSHVEDAKEIIQKMMKAEKQQADRIKALESENRSMLEDVAHYQENEKSDQDKLAKADAVILHLKETCESGIWAAGSDFVAMSVWRIKESAAAIEQYQKGE